MAPPGWRVDVEVVLLSTTGDGDLRCRTVRRPLDEATVPDEAALQLAGHEPRTAGTVSHSTSWRCPEPGLLVLTYAVLPDPDPEGADPLVAPSIVCSPDPLRPTPSELHGHHVAAHAVRHLAHLAGTDPTVAAAAAEHPALWSVVDAVSRGLPVAEHDSAHALARQLLRHEPHPAAAAEQ